MCGILCSDSYLFRKPPLTFELATTQFQVWSLQRSISTTGGAASLRARWNSRTKGPAHSWNICHSSVSLTHGPKPAQGQLLSKGPTLVSMSCPGNKELLSSQGSLSLVWAAVHPQDEAQTGVTPLCDWHLKEVSCRWPCTGMVHMVHQGNSLRIQPWCSAMLSCIFWTLLFNIGNFLSG